MKLKKREEAFIQHARVMRLATVNQGSGPHVVPVCPVLDRGTVYFATDPETQKVHNLKANPRVALVFDEYSDDWKRNCGVLIRGRAEIINDKMQFRRIRDLLYSKFQQYEKQAPLDPKDSLVVKVVPEASSSWGLK